MRLFDSSDIELEEALIALLVLAFFAWLSMKMGMFGSADLDDVAVPAVGAVSATAADLDGDGIPDSADACGLTVGVVENNGCPIDVVVEAKERVEEMPEPVAAKAAVVAAPAVAAVIDEPVEIIEEPVIVDTDGDGFADSDDECPTVIGRMAGCPADVDGDGFTDENDQCPNVAGPAAGCPSDQDNDGVVDDRDACPDKAGTAENGGCPEIQVSEEERAVIQEAISSITFLTSSATPTEYSQGLLGRVASVMQNNPDYKLRISGHTDAVGDDEGNLQLSKDRAKACFDYIAGQGVDSARMAHEGFGETQPVGDNMDADGRRANRRVEFVLHY